MAFWEKEQVRDDGSVRSPDCLLPVAGTWDTSGEVPGHEAGREPYGDHGNCLQVRDSRHLRSVCTLGRWPALCCGLLRTELRQGASQRLQEPVRRSHPGEREDSR